MKKPMLDIIVTRWNEPWEVGKKGFDMIEHQRCVDLQDIRVTVVQQDREEDPYPMPLEKMLGEEYSFPTEVLHVGHVGPAAARNVGLKHTDGDWVMFCDFDDMLADVCALRMFLSRLPMHDYDLIWGKYVLEQRWGGGDVYLNKVNESNLSNTICKFYRRAFLEENHITFDEREPHQYEFIFNAMVVACTAPFRIAMLTTDFYMFLKTHRDGSLHLREDALLENTDGLIRRDLFLMEHYARRGNAHGVRERAANILCEEYFRLYEPEKESPPAVSADFLHFYKKHREEIRKIPDTEMEVIRENVESEIMAITQGIYNETKREFYFANDTVPFADWVRMVGELAERLTEEKQDTPRPYTPRTVSEAPVVVGNNPHVVVQFAPQEEAKAEADPVEEKPEEPEEPRVVVYCGTYNTYLNMATSAKSLLWHTKIDKVYFLIEDDVFPYELPDDGKIECINVKDQKFFPESGPNYHNSWSYMCMMRAAFSKILPYSKVLSLDIDVVIQEDIGCLWDIDMTDYYLAGVAEKQRQKSSEDPLYINFGVVMMNLEKIRQDRIDDRIIEALNRDKYGCPEQDAFNKFCAWHIYQLENGYNCTVHSHITGESEKERILHYAGIKYWRHFGPVKDYALRPWGAVMERQRELV